MTFSMMVKDELASLEYNSIESRIVLSEYLNLNSKYDGKSIEIVIENAKIARLIFKFIKEIYNINANITVRNQKRFKIKQIYILRLTSKLNDILLDQTNALINIKTNEEKKAVLQAAFLARGSISNPSTSGYHLEFVFSEAKHARKISEILKELNFKNRIIKRNKDYMIYLKASESISDILKLFNATNSLFYFEDIRIYRDHKNMVNRLNNCEISNQEKVINTGLKQVDDIKYLIKNDLLRLLDDRTQDILNYRLKYPETSYEELANIISLETAKKITKSGINHHFIKMRKLKERHEK